MIQHVVPFDDNRVHVKKIYQLKGGINVCNCGCGAKVTTYPSGYILVNHNYFDPVKWVYDILKSK